MLRLAILSLLVEKPRHGYDIIKSIEELSSGVWRPAPGALYPTLRGLEEEGLVESRIEASGRRRRRTYSITRRGLLYLVERTREIRSRSASTILRYLRSQIRALELLGCPRSDVDNLLSFLIDVREKINRLIVDMGEKCVAGLGASRRPDTYPAA